MLATDPSRSAGLEVPNDLTGHGSRSAARRLVAGLFDAWDDGDEASFVGYFADDGSWRDPSGSEVSGPQLATRLAQWRAWEPWSIHWLSNGCRLQQWIVCATARLRRRPPKVRTRPVPGRGTYQRRCSL